MRFNLKEEYPDIDKENPEAYKQIIINKFKEHGLPLSKIRQGRLRGKEKGLFVYHPFGSTYYQNKREIIKQDGNRITYRRYKEGYKMNYVSTESFEDFENFLEMVIGEALIRKNH